jgi:hypothetical protein
MYRSFPFSELKKILEETLSTVILLIFKLQQRSEAKKAGENFFSFH